MLSLAQAAAWLIQYKYFALFPLAVIEGPIITVIAGFFASLGYINFFLAYGVVVAGDLVGDAFLYGIGRFGGRKFVDRWGRFIGVREKEIASVENQFQKRSAKILFIGKLLHGVGGTFLIAAGMVRMPFGQYIFYNFLATLVKSFILLLIGFFFGSAFASINSTLEKIGLFSIAIATLTLIIYFFYARKKENLEIE